MTPLTLDDLVPLDEFAGQRRAYVDSHLRYLDRYRRIRVGPLVTLLFENRQTLWFRVQEVLRIARLNEPRAVQRELDLFNRLLPGPGQLQAALLIEVPDPARLTRQLEAWADLNDDHLRLCLGQGRFAGRVLTSRPEDRCVGAAQWVQFTLDLSGKHRLEDLGQSAFVEIDMPVYCYRSAELSDDIRHSLVDDLRGAHEPLAA